MLKIWLEELHANKFVAALGSLFSDRVHQEAVEQVYYWFFERE
jgi:hypothetical protein